MNELTNHTFNLLSINYDEILYIYYTSTQTHLFKYISFT